MAEAPAGPASAVQGFVGSVMETVTAPVDALNLAVAKATLDLLQFLPKMPAARLFQDFVFQFGHTHAHPPSFIPPAPPIPIPSMSPILASGCWGVLINGLPAARSGDMGLAVWCGGFFPIFEVMTGSSHVFIGGSRAARQVMDMTYHCLPSPFGGKWGMGAMDIAGAVFGVGMSALSLAASMEGQAAADAKADKAETIAEESASDGQAQADAEGAAASAAAAAVGTATAAAQLAADVAAAAMGLLMGKDPGVGFPFGTITMGSPNVLIGGFPMPGWSNILKGLGKMLKPLIRKVQLKMPAGKMRNSLCFLTGHPVEVVTGRMFTSKEDFAIDGRIPIVFQRIYDTSAIDYESSLGFGWTHPYDQHLWHSKKYNCLALRNEEGRQVRFDLLEIGEKYFQPLERVWLERIAENEFELTDNKNGLIYTFGKINPTDENFQSEKRALQIKEIRNRNNNKIRFSYSHNLLQSLDNESGSVVQFIYSHSADKARLTEIREVLKNGQSISLMNYGYNGESELISATNRTYIPYKYQYENRLMIRETNRNGLSFYFEYDGEGTNAQCTHTWGDGGIYERWLTYFPKNKITKVKDGIGGETVYHYNDLDIVTKIFDAEGGFSQFEYGEYGELLKSTDQLNRSRTFAYDDFLNCVAVTKEDGTTKQVSYNDFGQPICAKDESGGEWSREYDEKGNIIATVNPLNARREYDYNEKGDVVKFRDSLKNELNFQWTNNGQIEFVMRPKGGKTSYQTNARNYINVVKDEVTGLQTHFDYDDAGRIKKVSQVNAKNQPFSVQRYEYDAQNNLTLYTDALGNKTFYQYSGYDKLSERVDALGHARRYKYDKDERLTEIVNENGENYLIEYDLLDRIVEEIRFDGAKYQFQYNKASELVYQKDELNRETFYQRDELGRLTEKLRSDATRISFEYDECGRMILAKNKFSEVKLTYDKAWNIVKEEQNGKAIEYKYDLSGRKISQKLEGKDEVKFVYDEEGNLSLTTFADNQIKYEHDQIGRLTNRNLPNGLQENFSYNSNGRLNSEKITVGANGREIVKRNYEWDALGNVTSVEDSLRGSRFYKYDATEKLQRIDRLIAGESVKLPDEQPKPKGWIPPEKRLWQADDSSNNFEKINEIEEFQYDGAGNLLQRNSTVKGSRKFKYSKGNKLERQEKSVYIYDAVGNLVEKRSGEGVTTRFSYDADNQLISILKDSKQIEFQYDAFGRRILKKTEANSTQFLWDGDVLLCEDDTQYLHNGFIPIAKINNDDYEIYHTDYLGTPKEVTDKNGNLVWQGNYDEYGKVNAVVNKIQQNIRFQGQYEDEETGLFYNRYRYYDADSGRYINQDPIGLSGGSNFFEYCRNPVNWIDPFGLEGDSITTFYHAGDISGPIDPSKGRPNLDFNPSNKGGFYVTTDKAQADEWAARKGVPVTKFEIPNEELAKLKIKNFDSPDAEWGETVVKGRKGALAHSFDGVSGPMLANPKAAVKGAKPKAKGSQLAIFSDEAAALFDKHNKGKC
ncbi:MAG: DUF6531 domain-containing protein [Pyrinomonadaceae bacterium]|nr:DUF6531 domain-containing protein [Pyrinomonadaceae bacterium]